MGGRGDASSSSLGSLHGLNLRNEVTRPGGLGRSVSTEGLVILKRSVGVSEGVNETPRLGKRPGEVATCDGGTREVPLGPFAPSRLAR